MSKSNNTISKLEANLDLINSLEKRLRKYDDVFMKLVAKENRITKLESKLANAIGKLELRLVDELEDITDNIASIKSKNYSIIRKRRIKSKD